MKKVLLLLALSPVSTFAQVDFTDVSDDEFFARIGRLESEPTYRSDFAISKSPSHASVGSPVVSGDSVTSIPVTYAWKAFDVFVGLQSSSETEFYAQHTESASASQIVDYAAELIGTPWEGATCAALLDAGFVEPCQIPPLEIPEVVEAPNPSLTECRQGYQETYANNPTISPAGKVADCVTRLMTAKAAAYPSLQNMRLGRTVCTGSTTKTMKIYARWGTYETATELAGTARWTDASVPCFNLYISDPLPTHTQGVLDPYNPPSEEEPQPTPSDITDGELVFKLHQGGLLTSNYLFNNQTGEYTYFTSVSGRTASSVPYSVFVSAPIPNTTTPSTPPSGSAENPTYSFTGTWSGFTSGSGGGGSPDPSPTPAPSASPSPDEEGQDDETPYDCNLLPGGCNGDLPGGSFDLDSMDAAIEAKKDELYSYFEGIRDDAASYWDFSLDNGAALPCGTIEVLGNQYDVCLDEYEEQLASIGTFVLFMSYLLGTFMIMRP